MITNTESGTNIHEIADGVYRINTPFPVLPGGFSFNQYLIVDEEPLLFHTGLRRTFPLVREAVASVMPVERLRYLGFSHFEADECGAINEFLAIAPRAEPVCSRIAAMTSVNDMADRPARAAADGEVIMLGRHSVQWIDTPHMPHSWECGMMFDQTTGTLLCSDLFTQPGVGPEPITESDILGPSEQLRAKLDYFAHSKDTRSMLEGLARLRPSTLACMHGSAWRGDGAALLTTLVDVLDAAHPQEK